ncbi:hypothetical protein D918_01959 [Trichuris suis]|nr:hypothetical protein D918_01959 [Trichuris suis]
MAVETLPFTIDNVRAAITSLYAVPPVANIPEVNKWLMTFQTQPISWEICAALILETENNVLVTFAGQTLRRKVQNRFDDLDPSMYDGLREALVASIRAIDYNKNRTAVTQVCLTLGGMYMKVGTWQNIVGDLFPRLNDTKENTLKFLLLVTLFMQDLRDNATKTSATRRAQIVNRLKENGEMLLGVTIQLFSSSEPEEAVNRIVLQAFAAYISVILSLEGALRCRLMECAFEFMASTSVSIAVHGAAAECIVEVLVKFDALMEFEEGENTPIGYVFARVSELRPVVLEAIQNKDTDRLINFARVYVELAKALTLVMVVSTGTNQGAMKPVGWILELMEYQNYAILEASGEFWYYFSEVLYQTTEAAQNANAFRAFVARLMSMFFRQCRFEHDFVRRRHVLTHVVKVAYTLLSFQDGVPPDMADFEEFRAKVSEIIKDVVFIIGSNKLLEQALKLMQGKDGWENVECAMFLMSCVVGNCVSNFADDVLVPVVSGIVSLGQEAPLALWYTSAVFVTEISEWFETRPQLLGKAFLFLMTCIARSSSLARVACVALTAICQDCAQLLVSHTDWCVRTLFASLDSSVPEAIPLELIKSVVAVVLWLPEKERSAKFHEVASRFCDDLLNVGVVNSEPVAQKKLALHLDRLSMLLLNVSVDMPEDKVHPLQECSVEIYEAVIKCIESNVKNSTVAERGCRALRYLIRSLGVHSLPLLEGLATKVFTFYQMTTHSCFLYLASILVDEFGADQRFVPGFLQMLQVLVPHALQVLNSYPSKKEVANTVEDLYRLGMRFAKKAPLQMFGADFFPPLLINAVEALKLDDLEALESDIKFLDEVLTNIVRIGKTDEAQSVQPTVLLIGRSGEALVNNLLGALVNVPPYPWYRRLAAVLFMMKQLYPQDFPGWMNSTYTLMSTRLMNEADVAKLHSILGEIFAANSPDDMRRVFHDLSSVCT